MTKQGSFKKVVRRHAAETGQRYTEALTDLEGLEARMTHEPVAERLLAHVREHYGIDATAATRVSLHKGYVFRIDRNDGDSCLACSMGDERCPPSPLTNRHSRAHASLRRSRRRRRVIASSTTT